MLTVAGKAPQQLTRERCKHVSTHVFGSRGVEGLRIPTHADHRFRSMPISDSDACRSPWSERVAVLENLP